MPAMAPRITMMPSQDKVAAQGEQALRADRGADELQPAGAVRLGGEDRCRGAGDGGVQPAGQPGAVPGGGRGGDGAGLLDAGGGQPDGAAAADGAAVGAALPQRRSLCVPVVLQNQTDEAMTVDVAIDTVSLEMGTDGGAGSE